MPDNTMSEFEISGSVGRWSKGALNTTLDVETVQDMLRLVAMVLHDPRFDPGPLSGLIDEDEQRSETVRAIEAFQARFLSAPDGLVEVGKRTWRELIVVLEGTETSLHSDAQFFFPFDRLPSVNWTESMRRFGAPRRGRAHAGCDLYFPVGTVIHAITSGSVVRGPYLFYQGTFALEIDHGHFLARYGEIDSASLVRQGDQVDPGQPIARVGDLINISNSMLHLELYDKSAHGALNVSAGQSARTPDGRPFMRRRDLIDPTPRLNEWKNNLPR